MTYTRKLHVRSYPGPFVESYFKSVLLFCCIICVALINLAIIVALEKDPSSKRIIDNVGGRSQTADIKSKHYSIWN